MRTIAASGVGSYRINDVEVTWEAYDKRLHQIGVLTKARNFLVFQVQSALKMNHFIPRSFIFVCARPCTAPPLSHTRPHSPRHLICTMKGRRRVCRFQVRQGAHRFH